METESGLPGIESEWPPLKKCAQYKSNLIQPYLRKQGWEDREDLSDDQPYDDPNDDINIYPPFFRRDGREINTDHNTIGRARRFLYQVRTSRGYDVDCRPPHGLMSPFMVMDPIPESYVGYLNKKIQLVIDHIHVKTGTKYEFVELLKLVSTVFHVDLMTFSAKEVGSTAEPKIFLATVYLGLDGVGDVCECILRPQGLPPTE